MFDESNPSFAPEVCLFASEALTKRVWALLDEAAGVRENRDPECLHRMRVASRRLRNALSLFGGCFPEEERKRWEKEARNVGRALGEARDADVQAASVAALVKNLGDRRLRPGAERLLLRLKQRRERLQPKVLRALDELEESELKNGFPEALRGLSARMRLSLPEPAEGMKTVRDAAVELLVRRAVELEAFQPVADHPERVEELHAMRIAVKRLRYTLEIFRSLFDGEAEPVLETLKKLQDLLGEVHDCDVWIEFLPLFLEKERRRTFRYFGHERPMARLRPGIGFLLEEFRRRRGERFEEFRDFWRKNQEAVGWKGFARNLGRGVP
jgi:CHAD domain-containing protein